MNPTAHRNEDNASAPVLYMALELSNKSWRLTFGDGTKRRERLREPRTEAGRDQGIQPGRATGAKVLGDTTVAICLGPAYPCLTSILRRGFRWKLRNCLRRAS